DCLYLNPIHESLSNHKYDAKDYLKISPEFGNFQDLNQLSRKLHDVGKKIMLDGVFNHVGVDNPLFIDANNEKSIYRDWFDFNQKYPHGVRLWADVASLPELNLENPDVRNYIYQNPDSVIRTYLKQGIDGWRLDVAFDIGYEYLKELTEAAHQEKSDAMIVGEIWNYPEKWLKSIDGVMNFTLREIILRTLKQEITPALSSEMISQMIMDAGIDQMLKSWNVLDNHDTPRLSYQLKSKLDQKLAQVMQFTLPGSPNIYYGTELGMEGAGDPVNRAPMRWDLYHENNEVLLWTKKLIDLHQMERAIKIGDYQKLISEKLIAYERFTDRVSETIIVLINPSNIDISDHVLIRDSSLMNYSGFDMILGEASNISFLAGILHLTLKKKSFVILKPQTKPTKSYTPYKRV
ncbi:MAG: glycoside hydrolase family 13 protein, partial [Bacillota bacterium]